MKTYKQGQYPNAWRGEILLVFFIPFSKSSVLLQ